MNEKDLFEKCRAKLLETKSQLLNQINNLNLDFNLVDKSRGDESDLASAHQEEHQFLINQSRMKRQLSEIEWALARMEAGAFGICEETEEKIEKERLLAIPWTRYSIEGAEIQESLNKKTATKKA